MGTIGYELTKHAEDMPARRGIRRAWIETALARPQVMEPDAMDSSLEHNLARIAEYGNRVLRVVVNKQAEPISVVTVYFDRKMRDKL